MEGLAGAVAPAQIAETGNEYSRYRKVMTEELLAAIKGAEEAGATEFVVVDAHGGGHNLIVEDLPANVSLIRGRPLPLSMMEGIQSGKYAGAMFIGYHASASSLRGVRAHTISSARFSEVKLNGVPVSEGYINAAVAAEFGVPIIMATGDDAAIEELRPAIGGAETVIVKRAISFHSAETMTPVKAQQSIRAAAKRAMERIGSFKAKAARNPVVLEITFHFYRPAEMLAWLPMVERTGARSIRYRADSVAAAVKFLGFVQSYSVELEP
jgi:D-amino peptidase